MLLVSHRQNLKLILMSFKQSKILKEGVEDVFLTTQTEKMKKISVVDTLSNSIESLIKSKDFIRNLN